MQKRKMPDALNVKSLRSELLSVKSSNQRMEEEMRQIKSVNINLRNDVRYFLDVDDEIGMNRMEV